MRWTADEVDAIKQMQRAGSYTSEGDLIRGALSWYARFLDIEIPVDVFALTAGRRRNQPKAKAAAPCN